MHVSNTPSALFVTLQATLCRVKQYLSQKWQCVTRRETKSLEDGFSMMEMMGTLFVYILLFVGVVAGISALTSTGDLTEAQRALSSIRMNIQTIFAGSKSYEGLDVDLAIDTNVFPSKMIKAGRQVLNPWGGDVLVEVDPVNTGFFTITYENVPLSDCIQIGGFQVTTWEDVAINGSALDINTASVQKDLRDLCTGDANTIVYTSR